MKAGFVGLGNMGSTIANLVASNGFEVTGWDYNGSVIEEINEKHTNSRYLPGTRIHQRVKASRDLAAVLQARVVFVALPSLFIRPTLAPVRRAARPGAVIVNLAKGIEAKTGLTSSGVLSRLFPGNPQVMLSGPSIANEIAAGMPTAVMLSGEDDRALSLARRLLQNRSFRAVTSRDRTGVELGGILKNIYAIGLGIFDGKGVRSINFRSVYLTLAAREMARFGVRLGAREESFYSLAGLGDLFATSLSKHSHNRRMGELLARGASVRQIKEKMGVLPEGYNTLRTVLAIARKKRVRLALAEGLFRVMAGRYDTERFMFSIIRGEEK
ncbi:MAG: NAD(P)H-dependent glycerol-3-phosphate dehydrogenase [Endomicrobiales bacterium]